MQKQSIIFSFYRNASQGPLNINNIMKSTQQCHYSEEAYLQEIHPTQVPRCRLCWKSEGELICPCKCSGSQAYVHQSCLETQIETARIMRVANVDGFYNCRCPLCKFHIQFKIQEYKCSLNRQSMRQAFKHIDEDSVASLFLNLAIFMVLFGIILAVISGHVRSIYQEEQEHNYTLYFIQFLLILANYIFLRNVIHRIPRKIRKPVLIVQEQSSII